MASLVIENEHLFRDALSRGINLFLGAGFSGLAVDKNNKTLPIGGELQAELVEHFKRSDLNALPLPKLSFILYKEAKEEFYDYLTRRFTIETYNDVYLNLLKIHVFRIFTTNIDDLIPTIYKNSSTSYLHDVAVRGARSDKLAIPYFPLHGCVMHAEKRYTFTPTEIASEFSRNPDDWYLLKREIYEHDTLFWGYRMEDADVLQSLADPPTPGPGAHKWILLRNPNQAERTYFQTLGFQIIEGETSDLLRFIGSIDATSTKEINTSDLTKIFPGDTIPHFEQVPPRPIREFFLGASPTWSDIFSTFLYTPTIALSIKNKILAGHNVVLVGLPLSGKTTLLMQIATGLQTEKAKLFIELVTPEKAAMTVGAG
jgi:SIR2-like domain